MRHEPGGTKVSDSAEDHAPRFLVQVTEVASTSPQVNGIQLTSSAAKKLVVEGTDDMLAAVRNAVVSVCRTAYAAFEEANRPDEIVVKFGVKLAAKGGTSIVFVTEATGEATLSFEAKWTNGGQAKPAEPKP
jgi:hypothetical protein